MDNGPNIAILGAGVVGLSVAKILQEKLKGAKITVLSEKFKEDTVSAVAAGIFRPGTSFKGPTPEITKKWMSESWYYWQDILKTSEAANAGVMEVGSYIFSKDNPHVTRNHLLEGLVPIYRPVEEKELKICGGDYKYGSYFSTIKAGCDRYLPWAEKKFTERGGIIEDVKINTFSSLAPRKLDLVFNCTGMGAKYLCNDHDLVPIRGQIIKVKAPWIKSAFYADYDTYIIPNHFDGTCTLGGVRQYDSYNMDVCKYDAASIMDRCSQLFPQLRQAEVIAHRVGLRPHRIPVRVEPELIDGMKVVHCYGHGGYGVMCAPGTAIDAIDKGLDFLKTNVRNKL